MAIQNSINQMAGAVGTLAATSQFLGNQKKELEIKKLEAEDELETAKANERKGINEAIKHAKVDDNKTWNEATSKIAKETEGPEIDAEKVLDEYNNMKQTAAQKELSESHLAFDLANMAKDDKQITATSLRLAKAQLANESVQDEIEAKRKLKFDVNLAKKKFEALGGKE